MKAKMTLNQLKEMVKIMDNKHIHHDTSNIIYISVNDKTGEVEFELASYYQECVGSFFRYKIN